MRTRFDQVGKQLGEAALGPSGTTVVHDEIVSEVQYADLRHEPDPARVAERARLGLLGQLAAGPCLIEIYSQPPDSAAFRACVSKHLAVWQQRVRRARTQEQAEPATLVEPQLWIIAAGRPETLLRRLELVPAPGWPPGVYRFGGEVLRVGLVAAGELPRERSTLLVRLMAAGAGLRHALADLMELPADAHERLVAGPVLLRLHHALRAKADRNPEEQENHRGHAGFLRVRARGRAEAGLGAGAEAGLGAGAEAGLGAGLVEARANDLLTVLRRARHPGVGGRARAHPRRGGSGSPGALARAGDRRADAGRGARRAGLTVSPADGYFLRTSCPGGMTAGGLGESAIGSRSVVPQ